MDRQEFRDKLQSGLRTVLHENLQQHLNNRIDSHEQLLGCISALDRKYDTDEAIMQGFPGIFENIEKTISQEDSDRFLDRYLVSVDKLTEGLPEYVIWEQDENRFVAQSQDSLSIKTVKTNKRLLRSFFRGIHKTGQWIKELFGGSVDQYSQWKQEIPLQRFVICHLLDEEFVSKMLHNLHRMQLEIINEIEELLVADGNKEGDWDFEQFGSSEKAKLEQKRNDLLQRLSSFIDQKATEIKRDIEKVGTIEQRESAFSQSRLDEAKKQLVANYKADEEQWKRVQQLFIARTKDIVQFLNLRAELLGQINEFKETYHGYFDKYLDQPISELRDILQQAIEQVRGKDSTGGIADLKDELSSFVSTRLIEPIQKLINKRILSKKTEHLFEDLLLSVGESSEKAILIFDTELEKNPAEVDQKEVEWRQLVIRGLREQFMNALQPSSQQYEEFLGQRLEEIQEIENIISVNLESALEAKEEDLDQTEDVKGVAREALERILSKVEELHDRASEKWTSIEEHISEGEGRFSTSLLLLLHEGDVKELQLLNAKYKVKEKTKDWRTVLDSQWAAIEDRLLVWFRFADKKSKKYLLRSKDFLGFKEEQLQEAKRADIASYLSETDQKIKELPYIYRQLFDFHTAADKRFNVTTQESTQTFKKAFEQWQKEKPALFAVVGEKGSGKSSFIDLMIDEQMSDQEVITIEFEDTIWIEEQLTQKISTALDIGEAEDIDALIAAINKSNSRKAVVLESVQNCFLRDMDGFEAIEKLSYLITETRVNVFWMVSCSRYAWAFLDKVMQISEYFSHVAKSDGLNAEQIEEVILNRHRASGYSLYFEPAENTLQSRAFRKLKDDEDKAQEHLREEYFENLTKLAEGNASVAIIFWIRSIRDFDDTCFYINPLEITQVEMLENLSTEVLFTLATFVLHDTLLDEHLSMGLNNTLEESRLMLNRLRSRGLLEKRGEYYTINHLMYRQIIRVLKERNIIHLV